MPTFPVPVLREASRHQTGAAVPAQVSSHGKDGSILVRNSTKSVDTLRPQASRLEKCREATEHRLDLEMNSPKHANKR